MTQNTIDPTKMKSRPFIPHEEIAAQILTNITSGYAKSLGVQKLNGRSLAIIAGGPSVTGQMDNIRKLADDPNVDLCVVNGMHDMLIREKIPFKYMLMVDPRIKHLKHVKTPKKDVTYWIASQCHPKVFETLKDNDLHIWHINNRRHEESIVIAEHYRSKQPFILCVSGSTAGTSAVTIGYSQGYRDFYMFGFDSCLNDKGEHHAYPNVIKDVVDFEVEGHKFKTTRWMIQQLTDFQVMFNLYRPTCTFHTYGYGMVQIAHQALERQYDMSPFMPPQIFITNQLLPVLLKQKYGE